MKDSREKKIKGFLCSKTNTKVFKKENKVYSFLLHEDLYSVILKNADFLIGKSNSVFPKSNIFQYPKGSYLTVKYIISILRSNKFIDIKRFFLSEASLQEHQKYENSLSLVSNGSKVKSRVGTIDIGRGQLKKKFVSYLVLESIAFILLGSKTNNGFEKLFINPKNVSISIHKSLESIEKQWQYDSFGFQGCFFRFFHPEIIMRILRKNFQDISFLHLIRKFLHSKMYSVENFFTESPYKKIRNIFWNFYVLEIDNFFVSDRQYYYHSQKLNFASINHSFSFLQKLNEWTDQKEDSKNPFEIKYKEYFFSSFFALCSFWAARSAGDGRLLSITRCNSKDEWTKRRQISFLGLSSTYKYVRTQTSWFIFFKKEKPWILLTKRRISLFFMRRLGYVFQESTKSLPLTFIESDREKASYFFLAHFLQYTKKRNFVKINTKLFFLLNFFVKRIISFINPFYLIILLLAKQKFCSFFGSPRTKFGWVLWTDSEIIQQFNRIRNSLFLFYSGCNNTKALSRLQYILYFSCAKTLACKHKTNIRQIYKKFDHNIRITNFPRVTSAFLVKNNSKNFRLRLLYKKQKNQRFWNFHFTQMDSILLHLENLYGTI